MHPLPGSLAVVSGAIVALSTQALAKSVTNADFAGKNICWSDGTASYGKDGSFDSSGFGHGAWSLQGDQLVVSGTITATKSRASYFFDKETGLLSRTVFFYPTILGSIEQINEYANYQKVGGVMVPMKITNHSTEGDTVMEFSSATAESKIDATVFDPHK